jgi:uncharacterized protein YneF (UPF0154 family)
LIFLSLPEKFLIYLFSSIFAVLALVSGILIFFFIKRKDIVEVAHKPAISRNIKRKIQKTQTKEISNKYKEKLGEKVVQYMIEVANSSDEKLVRDRIERIKKECERLNSLNLPAETKEIISTVLLWTKKFNVHRHLREMKLLKKSTQIRYDHNKKDFKLLIPGE